MSQSKGQTAFGLDFQTCSELIKDINLLQNENFTFGCFPLFHPRFHRTIDCPQVSNQNLELHSLESLLQNPDNDQPLTRSDLLLPSEDWINLVVGKTSPWLDLDSPNPHVRLNSRKVLLQEIGWASHLSLSAVLLPTLEKGNNLNLAQVLGQILSANSYFYLWLRVPTSFGDTSDSAWHAWIQIKSLADAHPRLAVALELTEKLPEPEIVSKWFAEPVRAIVIPFSLFRINKNGFPTLSHSHQNFISRMFRFKVPFIFTGNPILSSGFKHYLSYINFLFSKSPPFSSDEELSEVPYLDYLQMPLQPLMDNLESQTYETFEKDLTKYNQYEEAITLALKDWDSKVKEIILMVVGAGRGPLVAAALRASVRAQRQIRVYAVEKNPNAVITLRNRKLQEKWGNRVTIIDADMRQWNAPEKAHILVSELLGSFGDNELSPECLDGAQRFLDPECGISIPCKYVSTLAPLSASRVWNEVRNTKESKSFETPFVVKFHVAKVLNKTQECFTFFHPNWDQPINNDRFLTLRFEIPEASVIHGFAGYFDCTLYKDVHLSTDPHTHTVDMHSWFPIYFPIKEPMFLPKGSSLDISIWRLHNKQKIWYEWALQSSVGQITPIHNPNGRSYWIGL